MIQLIDHVVDKKVLESAVKRYREKGILLPTFAQQKDPALIPEKILDKLKNTGLWDLDPINLFRITWHNEPKENGGLFGNVNYIVLPPELTGVKTKIVALIGKWFPTGSHKVGAAYG
ncbi:pyridoxal-5-phosphate-dependent protein subunit beta, partial [bacterium]|nr:pyridoxal-5-phosphate-dependent protein subunit beta [bacterium]